MHQAYRQWSIADGNDSTPMEVDALMKGKDKKNGKGKGKEKSKEKGKAKNKDKPKEGTSDTSSMKCFSAWRKAAPERIAPNSRPGSLRRRQWGHEREELCELIMIDSGASVHVSSSMTRPLLTASGAEMKQHGM